MNVGNFWDLWSMFTGFRWNQSKRWDLFIFILEIQDIFSHVQGPCKSKIPHSLFRSWPFISEVGFSGLKCTLFGVLSFSSSSHWLEDAVSTNPWKNSKKEKMSTSNKMALVTVAMGWKTWMTKLGADCHEEILPMWLLKVDGTINQSPMCLNIP